MCAARGVQAAKEEKGKAKAAEAGVKAEKKEKKVREMPTKKEEAVCISMLDIRVGKIVKVERHPDADRCATRLGRIDVSATSPLRVCVLEV